MNFCSHCGHPVELRNVPDDERPRHVCISCQTIHYQNPKIVCGCLATWQDRILLCRRAIEPRLGYWTLPAGFMENGETTLQGALRETWEEAQAHVTDAQLYCVFNIPSISQVYLMFRGEMTSEQHSSGTESLETALFSEKDIPWHSLAFPAVRSTLDYYLEDRKTNSYPLHMADLG